MVFSKRLYMKMQFLNYVFQWRFISFHINFVQFRMMLGKLKALITAFSLILGSRQAVPC